VSKTRAILTGDVYQSRLKEGDKGYIDGYVRGGDERPYAVFVRDSDGLIDMVSIIQLRAEANPNE
jgi:hypothetical protein